MRHPRSLLAAAVAALSLPVAGATAATPTTIADSGEAPNVAIGPSGTGYVTWFEQGSGSTATKVQFCRVAVGTQACAGTATLAFPTPDPIVGARIVGRPYLFSPSAGTLVLVASCYGCGSGASDITYRWLSTDDGANFAPPTLVHLPTGDGRSNGLSATGGAFLSAAAPDAPVVFSRGDLVMGTSIPAPAGAATTSTLSIISSTGVAPAGDGTHVIAIHSEGAKFDWSRFTDPAGGPSSLTAAEIESSSNWSFPAGLPGQEPSISDVSLAGPGKAGPVMVYRVNGGRPGLGDAVLARTYDAAANTWSAPVPVNGGTGEGDNVTGSQIVTDAGGGASAVWENPTRSQIRYARSEDGGKSWGAAGTLVKEGTTDPRIAVRADGSGLLVYPAGGRVGPLRLVVLDPQAEPGVPSPITPTTPPTTPKPLPGPGGASPTKTTSATLAGGGTISLSSPRRCVARGATLRVTLKLKRSFKKGAKVVGVTRTEFYIGSKRVKTDRKAPFVQTLRVAKSAKSGSRVILRVRVSVKVKRGKGALQSIRVTFPVC